MPEEVNVTQIIQSVTVTEEVYTVEVSMAGPQGPPGTGSGSTTYLYGEVISHHYVDFNNDEFLAVDSSGGPITLTLPVSNSGNQGKFVVISKTVVTAFAVTVQTQSGQLIIDFGLTSHAMDDSEVLGFLSTGSGYKLI